MAYDVRLVNPLERADWDEGLRPFPATTFFHTAAWARVLSETYGYRPRYVTLVDGERTVAILPLMEVSSWLTGRRGVSLPFTDYCAPLAESNEASDALTHAAVKFGESEAWKYIEFRSECCFAADYTASLAYWRHVVDLKREEDAQFAILKSTVRTAIRKSIGAGVQVDMLQTRDAVLDFCRLNAMTRRGHGLPPQPQSFFESLHRHAIECDAGVVAVARVDGKPAAASLYLFRGDRAMYKYGASNREFQHLRVNDLVMWEAMRWLAKRGCTSLSLGKTAVENHGLRRFKLGWGATESEIKYFKYNVRDRSFVKDRDAIEGWHNSLFRAMPEVLSRAVGAFLYRHMA